jgi:predicted PurR-regulated permease PerM
MSESQAFDGTLRRAERRRAVHRAFLVSAGALVPVLLFLLLWFGAQAFLLVFAGYLVAVFVRAPTRWVARRARLSHRLAFALVLLILTLLAFALGSWAAPRVAEQADELSRQLPLAFWDLTRQLGQ